MEFKKKEKKETKEKKEDKKPVWIHWGAYDYETYTAVKGEKRTQDVKPYAVGWTHNIGSVKQLENMKTEKKIIKLYKQNYQYIYHDNDISIEFIKELTKNQG